MPKILVADDNTNIQKMVSLAFEERGIDVVSVGNGEAAVRRIPDVNPDLVLADIFMPVRNGYEVCEFIKKDSRFSHVPVILLVGAFDPLDEKEARRVGADGVLKKPFVPPDPLIAMVISALEKNPKIAAEIAKTREAAAAPPPPSDPQPLPTLDMPARSEVKPLPEYPEPPADEAALAYGYAAKSGRDAAGQTGEEKPPISLDPVELEQPDDNEPISGSGGSWRPNAMDFEVPEETSRTTAFALDDDAAGMFPSERDVPPKHISQKNAVFAGADVAPQILPGAAVKSAVPVTAGAPASRAVPPIASSGYVPPPPPPVSSLPLSPPPSETPAAESLAPAPVAEQMTATMSEAPADQKCDQNTASAADKVARAVEALTSNPAESATESSLASRTPHWMDAMKAALERPNAQDVTPNAKSSAEPVAAASAASPADLEGPVASPIPVPAPLSAAPPVEEATRVVANLEPSPGQELDVVSGTLQPEDEDAFFAAENETANAWIRVEPEAGKTNSQATSDPAVETSAPLAAGRISDDPEWVAEVDSSRPMAKDPALIVPPAVKVTPEPLLVRDTPAAGGSGYSVKAEATAAPFEFAEQQNASVPEAPVLEERIPTGPPPSREALAEIPFLTPTSEFLNSATEPVTAQSEEQDVDALVRKVMEKLEPQLHNLLSQGVLKPLVENIIQGDLAKKER